MMRFAEELVAGDELAPGGGQGAEPAREAARAAPRRRADRARSIPAKHPDEYRSAVLAAVDEKVEAGEVARDGGQESEAASADGGGGGAQVIDLAELLSRSIKVAGKPGPAKAKSADEPDDEGREGEGAVEEEARGRLTRGN